MSEAKHSSKLAALLRLCFTAGIVVVSGAAIADCELDHTVCTQPGPVHGVPSVCDQYPDNIACLDHGAEGGPENPYAAISLSVILGYATGIPRVAGNAVQASCASPYNVRLTSALQDVSAWWSTFGGAWSVDQSGRETISVTYSNGQREIWALSHGSFGGDPGIYIGNNPYLGQGVLASLGADGPYGIYGQYAITNGGIYGGGPVAFEFCQ